jgi:hypothetical protein
VSTQSICLKSCLAWAIIKGIQAQKINLLSVLLLKPIHDGPHLISLRSIVGVEEQQAWPCG